MVGLLLLAVGLMAGMLYAERQERARALAETKAAETRVRDVSQTMGAKHNELVQQLAKAHEKADAALARAEVALNTANAANVRRTQTRP
jgi:uncharacterized protein YneF (UPF0154 family)